MAETVDRFPDRLKSTSNFLEDAGGPRRPPGGATDDAAPKTPTPARARRPASKRTDPARRGSAAATAEAEDERVVHLHVAAALRLRELDVPDHVGDAVGDVGIDAAAGRRRDVAVRGD